MRSSPLRIWLEPVKKHQEALTNLELKRNRSRWGLLAQQLRPIGVGQELRVLPPLPLSTKKPRHSFRAAKRTIFAPDGTLYKSVLLTNRAELSSKPISWWRER